MSLPENLAHLPENLGHLFTRLSDVDIIKWNEIVAELKHTEVAWKPNEILEDKASEEKDRMANK